MAEKFVDVDASDGLKVVQDAIAAAKDHQQKRVDQFEWDYKNYSAYLDMTTRNPALANVYIPKIRSIVETKSARDFKALWGLRPFIPFEATNGNYADVAKAQCETLDDILDRSGFGIKGALICKLKTNYGTAFFDFEPYYETVTRVYPAPVRSLGANVGVAMKPVEIPLLRFRIGVYGPWEIWVDPFATDLAQPNGCRWVVKMKLASKREIIRLAQDGKNPDYVGIDIAKLEDSSGSSFYDHDGLRILSSIGFSVPQSDSDMGIMFCFESVDRCIRTWNNQIVLTDKPNDIGKINLVRMLHNYDAHTQGQFFGQGEAKINEILQSMLNDQNNTYLNALQMVGQPMIAHSKDIPASSVVWRLGARVAVNPAIPIQNQLQIIPGANLPVDHQVAMDRTERHIDLSAGLFKPSYGETTSGDKTLGEIALMKEVGDERQEVHVKLGEKALGEAGELLFALLEKYAGAQDVAETVGIERALKLTTLNPARTLGGFRYQFKGSDSVANKLIRQRNIKEAVATLGTWPNVSKYFLATEYLKALDTFDHDRIEQSVIPDEVMMMLQGMMMASKSQNQETPSGKGELKKQGEAQRVSG